MITVGVLIIFAVVGLVVGRPSFTSIMNSGMLIYLLYKVGAIAGSM